MALPLTQPAVFPGVGRTTNVVIATKHSPWADSADYVCTGTSDEEIINKAITDRAGSIVLLDGDYKIDGPILLNKTYVFLSGPNRTANNDSSTGVRITASGLAAAEGAIEVTQSFCSVAGIHLKKGTGVANYGLIANNAAEFLMRDVDCEAFTTYGIHLKGGMWYTVIDHCRLWQNGTGLFSVTDVNGQNGNGLYVAGTLFEGNAGTTVGAEWGAAQCTFIGNTIEGAQYGLIMRGDNSTSHVNLGFNIIGNYFEANSQAHILVGRAGKAAYGNIHGNYFTGTASIVDHIRLTEMTGGTILDNTYANADLITGRAIASTTVGENVLIQWPTATNGYANAPTFGSARVIGSQNRRLVVPGDTHSTSLNATGWPAGGTRSNALTAGGTDTWYLYIPGLKPNDWLDQVVVKVDGHANDTVTVKVNKALSGAASWTQVATSGALAGNATITLSGVNYRVEDDTAVQVSVQVTASADVVNRFVYNPRIQLARV